MLTNRKGLSEVVTAVLVILLIVAAVAAIWAFVNPAITTTGKGLTKAQICTNSNIEPISCKRSGSGASLTADVVVRRTTSAAGATLTGVSVNVDHETAGQSSTAAVPIGGLSADQVTAPKVTTASGQTSAASVARVVSTYTLSDSTTVPCTSAQISCTA